MDLQTLRERFAAHDIRRVKVGGFDVDGVLRGKYLSLDKFWSALESGFGFCDVIFGWDIADALYDNASTTGWHSGYPDVLARIDPTTLRFAVDEPHTAHLLVDFATAAGKPHPACPRSLLKRIIARAEAAGYRPKVAVEFEFWVFQESADSLHAKSFRDLQPLSPGMFGYSWLRAGQRSEWARDVLDSMLAYDIPIEGLHTETGPGVWEVAIRYDDALQSADKAALFKTMLKQQCARHGLSVTFMAKWRSDLPGAGGHIHQSLWDAAGEHNLFADRNDPQGLSSLARRYIAGQLHSMPDLTAVYAPFVNSYKRFVPGVWAPLTASWGLENRTCALRIVGAQAASAPLPANPSATRVEFRLTGADLNPYLAIASSVGAGLWGIEQALEAPPSSSGDASTEGTPLPRDLAAANARLAASDIAPNILGAAFVDHYSRSRDWEVRQHQRSVSDWELRRYFEAV